MCANHNPGTVRLLYCNCCGERAGRFAQHWNQDTGYGICHPCIVKMYRGRGETEETIRSYFGVEGVNFANGEQWAKLAAEELV
jgi:hypothetical protein